MPLRSVMMKRFILGFHRRVWCPKWTPLSRSWRMVTTAMPRSRFLLVVQLVLARAATSTRPLWRGRDCGGAPRHTAPTTEGRGGAPVSSCANSSGTPGCGHTTRAIHLTATVLVMRNPLVTRMTGFGTTIFAEMTQRALQFDAVNLGQGFPDTDGPQELLDIARESIASGLNQYSPAIGMPVLRAAVAHHQRRFYGLEVDPDTEVLVTVGATEAIAAS